MKHNYTMACVAILYLLFNSDATAQGCVAIRNMALGDAFSQESKTWQFSANYRYFHSYKHFVGKEEQTQRIENKNNVINNDHSIILGGNFTLNNRWSFGLSVPFMYINRSSLYEHYGNGAGNPRFNTTSSGLGDIRFITNYRLIDQSKFKLQLGAGFKLPTGDYKAGDFFHRRGSQGQDSLTYRVVDQSIQPGDGGFGLIAGIDLVYKASDKLSVYANGMYLSNPRNTNGVQRSTTLTRDANGNFLPLSNEFSVVDQYIVRAGARYRVTNAIEASLGGRIECIPSHDIIGREDGFRRPGYVASVDPAIFYFKGNHVFGLNVPVALVRDRTRSYIDIQRGIGSDGKPVHGDAAFADFLVSVSYAFKIPKRAEGQFGKGTEVIK
jgi:hypothetical protein